MINTIKKWFTKSKIVTKYKIVRSLSYKINDDIESIIVSITSFKHEFDDLSDAEKCLESLVKEGIPANELYIIEVKVYDV